MDAQQSRPPALAQDMGTRFALVDGALVVECVQQCTPIAEDATRRREEGIHGSSEFRHAARIPDVMIEAYCNRVGITYEEWCSNKEHIRRVLNDPAMAHFRVWPGRV